MMSNLTCSACGKETSEELNFCLHCEKQIKCLNRDCNELLIPEKTFCFHCGQPIGAISTSQASNRYVRRVTQQGRDYTEHTELNVSDHAVNVFAPFVTREITSPTIQPPYYGQRPDGAQRQQQAGAIAGKSGEINQHRQLPPKSPEKKPLEGASSDAWSYFDQDEEYLIANVKDFKGKNWAEQQRNFILMYTAAYIQKLENAVPSKDHYKNAAIKNNIYDASNFSRYVTELARELITEFSDGFKLNSDGEKEIEKIIARIEG